MFRVYVIWILSVISPEGLSRFVSVFSKYLNGGLSYFVHKRYLFRIVVDRKDCIILCTLSVINLICCSNYIVCCAICFCCLWLLPMFFFTSNFVVMLVFCVCFNVGFVCFWLCVIFPCFRVGVCLLLLLCYQWQPTFFIFVGFCLPSNS